MKNIMWLRIILTGLAIEVIYGLYIGFIRWYEESILTSVLALVFLMVIGGYLVARKAHSKHLLQGALVGLVGVLFYIVVAAVLTPDDGQAFFGLQFWLEDLTKIGGGAFGGYLGLKQGEQ
ncbi:MAG: TIGR04086 family membrane protein [Saprospiraceae bacterium]|nr:TIGR04086 family membrane protein [Saprospiraceae bacterium]MCB0666752.1 TIGR04086 family membrane protein [Saprospiraceae bacterium]